MLAPQATECIKKNWPDRPRYALVEIEACRLKKGGSRDGPRDAGRRQGDRRGTLRGATRMKSRVLASPTKTKSPNPDSGIPSGRANAHFHSGAVRVDAIDPCPQARSPHASGVVGPTVRKIVVAVSIAWTQYTSLDQVGNAPAHPWRGGVFAGIGWLIFHS